MKADENPEVGALSPETVGGSPVSIHLYVEDVDAVVARVVSVASLTRRPSLVHRTHKEDLTTDEIHRRAAAQGR